MSDHIELKDEFIFFGSEDVFRGLVEAIFVELGRRNPVFRSWFHSGNVLMVGPVESPYFIKLKEIYPFCKVTLLAKTENEAIKRLWECLVNHYGWKSKKTISVEKIDSASRIPSNLTGKELEILHSLCRAWESSKKEMSNKDIADLCKTELSTVNSHLNSIYKKLDVHSKRDAIRKGIDLGVLTI